MKLTMNHNQRHCKTKVEGAEIMERIALNQMSAIAVLLCIGSIAAADTKFRTKTTASGQSFESTVYVKGHRQRSEQAGMATINQCDLNRVIQLNDKAKTYMIVNKNTEDSNRAGAPVATPNPGAKSDHSNSRRGG